MSSSWDIGRDNFYAVVTNTNNPTIFTDNHPAEFRVQFYQNIILDPEEWEVCLANIHYVHDFPNIGKSTFIKIRHHGEIYILNLPQWYSKKVEDLCNFISSLINGFFEKIYKMKNEQMKKTREESIEKPKKGPMEDEATFGSDLHLFRGSSRHQSIVMEFSKENENEMRHVFEYSWSKIPKIEMNMDSLERLKLSCSDPDFDIAFSNELLDMLGLYSEHDFTIEAFNTRSVFWEILLDACFPEGMKSSALLRVFRSIWRFSNHTKFKAQLNFDAPLLGYPNSTKLNEAISEILGSGTALDVLKQVLYDNSKDESEKIDTDEKIIRFKSEFEQHVDNEAYNTFLINCFTADIKNQEPNKPELDFNSQYSVFLTSYMLKKIIHGSLSDSIYVSKTPGRINPFELLYIYSDLVKPDPFNDMMSRILTSFQTFNQPGEMITFAPNPRQYKSLDKSNITTFKILIASDRGERVPFQRGPSVLTLHFRRRKFFPR